MAFTLSKVRRDGCLFSPPSSKDYRALFPAREIPDRVDLRQSCTAVENQGQLGSCAANAAVGAVEFFYKRRDGRSPDLSRLFVYYNARKMQGDVTSDSGAFIRMVMASLMGYGACTEDRWAYDPAQFAEEPPKDAYDEALTHEPIQYARVDGVAGATRAIAEGLPVVFACAIPDRLYDAAATGGAFPALTEEERTARPTSGHAMLLVGYDNRQQAVIVRNSWGEEWGDRGYGYIPYDVVDTCAAFYNEFWVVADLEQRAGLRLVKPAQRATDRKQGPPGIGTGVAGAAASLRDQIRSSLEADLSASSRKVDALLKGPGATPRPAVRPGVGVMPCTACAGSGICVACRGQRVGCARCRGTGACPDCGGTGVL